MNLWAGLFLILQGNRAFSMQGRFGGIRKPGVTAVLTLLLFSPVACTDTPLEAQAEGDLAQTFAAIERLSDSWIEAFEVGDAEAFAAFFMEDAIYAANNGELLHGREEIRHAMSRWASRRPEGVDGDVRTTKLRLRAAGDVAYMLTRFTITATPPGRVVEAGHLLVVLRRQTDGTWLIESLVGNRDP
jgi:uncharacterized protein (TIGR02246 family)